MARIGSFGSSDPGPVPKSPREFPLIRVASATNLGGSSQTGDVDGDTAHRSPQPIRFGLLEVYPYGGTQGGVVIIPERFDCVAGVLVEDDADRRDSSFERVFKWTFIYESLQARDAHPHLVPFRGRDPWTGFPVLEQPEGRTLADFLQQNATHLYTAGGPAQRRLQARYLPLAYQWALELLSVLLFLHQHHVCIGDMYDSNCWLSESSLSLSVMGFSSAAVRFRVAGHIRFAGDLPRSGISPNVHNILNQNPTETTDLFVWICVIVQIMTGSWPDRDAMVNFSGLPRLSTEHLGGIIKRIWDGGLSDAAGLQRELITEIGRQGWETEGRYQDKITGFSARDFLRMEI